MARARECPAPRGRPTKPKMTRIDGFSVSKTPSPNRGSRILLGLSRDKKQKNHHTRNHNIGIGTMVWVSSRNPLLYTLAILIVFVEILQWKQTLNWISTEEDNDAVLPHIHMMVPPRKRRPITTSYLKRHAAPTFSGLQEICKIRPGKGEEGLKGFQALSKVQVANIDKNTPLPPGVKQQRVLCIVLTDSTRHKGALRAIVETYAPSCDGFLAASNATDPALGALDLWSELPSDATDWHKVRLVWKHIHTQHKKDYDFFHLCGDDAYVIPQNLIYQLSISAFDEGRPAYIGGGVVASEERPKELHCGGGAGYTLNRVALNLYREAWDHCHAGSSLQADQAIAACFREQQVNCYTLQERRFEPKITVDGPSKHEGGAWMYHEFGPNYHAGWNIGKRDGLIKNKILAKYYGIVPKAGIKGIAEYSTTFHLVDGADTMPGSSTASAMRRVHAIVFKLCSEEWERSLGALDQAGNPGYIHDPAYVKNHPLPFTYHAKGDDSGVCDIPFGEGPEKQMGLKGLEKIKIMKDAPKRVLCIVYTHSNRHDRVRSIAETYAPRCDGFMAASNLTDVSIGAVNLLHEGPEAYANMWGKVRSIWRYVYDNYMDEYDFFQIGGDDYYLVAENLRHVVSTGSWKGPWDQSSPLYLGGALVDMPYKGRRYCGGGSGYSLNAVALKLMIEKLYERQPCWPHWEAPDEDRIIASCFGQQGILCMDTNDHLNETRYHPLDVNFHSSWKAKSKAAVWLPQILKDVHGIASKEGLGQISETSVSFHLKDHHNKGSLYADGGLRRYHAILYGLCGDKSSAQGGASQA